MVTWALDLDGVMWTGTDPIAGSADAVSTLRDAGHDVVFVTNNSFATIAEQEAKLAAFGVDAVDCVITSAQAGASLLEPNDSVLVLGGPGIREAVVAAGARLAAFDEPADVVMVGLDWDLSYDRLRAAVQAVLGGARFIATNTDPTYPTERGLYPGAGALVAAVATSTGRSPEIAGKPHAPQAELVRRRFGTAGVMVGDRPDTDGHFAQALGYRFGLVFSGVTSRQELPVDPAPALMAADLAALVEQYGGTDEQG